MLRISPGYGSSVLIVLLQIFLLIFINNDCEPFYPFTYCIWEGKGEKTKPVEWFQPQIWCVFIENQELKWTKKSQQTTRSSISLFHIQEDPMLTILDSILYIFEAEAGTFVSITLKNSITWINAFLKTNQPEMSYLNLFHPLIWCPLNFTLVSLVACCMVAYPIVHIYSLMYGQHGPFPVSMCWPSTECLPFIIFDHSELAESLEF